MKCSDCTNTYVIPPEGPTLAYPCGDIPWDSNECQSCVENHIRICTSCAQAIKESSDD